MIIIYDSDKNLRLTYYKKLNIRSISLSLIH